MRYARCGRQGHAAAGRKVTNGRRVATRAQVLSVDLSLTVASTTHCGRLPFATALSMKFRPCIDLHSGAVKQIVGSSLKDGEQPRTNFVSELPSAHYAELYRKGNATHARCLLCADAD